MRICSESSAKLASLELIFTIVVLLLHKHVLARVGPELQAVSCLEFDVLCSFKRLSIEHSTICTFKIYEVRNYGKFLHESFEGASLHLFFRSQLDLPQLLAELNDSVLVGTRMMVKLNVSNF